jgi:membrane protein DedA with SNARE-associated domain
VGVTLGIALETFVPILPSEVIVPMAGWKIAQSATDPATVEPLTGAGWSFLGALVAATVGAGLGSLAGYLIGAWGGRPLLDRYGRWVHIHPEDLDRADDWFARHGAWAVLICRLIPLLRALINYPAGVARMPVGRFLAFSILGSIPWNAALLFGGQLLGANYEALYRTIRPFEIVIYAIVVVGIVVVLVLWLRGRRAPTAEEA